MNEVNLEEDNEDFNRHRAGWTSNYKNRWHINSVLSFLILKNLGITELFNSAPNNSTVVIILIPGSKFEISAYIWYICSSEQLEKKTSHFNEFKTMPEDLQKSITVEISFMIILKSPLFVLEPNI